MSEMIKATWGTIKYNLAWINESFPNKFEIAKPKPGEKYSITEKVWMRYLQDIDSESIGSAVVALCGQNRAWPPNVGEVREKAILFASGDVSLPDASEAWGHVLEWVRPNSETTVTDLEKEAVKRTFPTTSDILQSKNPPADRARFCTAFDDLVRKDIEKRTLLPEVGNLIEAHKPPVKAFLGANTDTDTGGRYLSFDEAREMAGDKIMALIGGAVGGKPE